MSRRPWLLALALALMAPLAEASLTRASAPALGSPALTLASPAATPEPSEFSLFEGTELAVAASAPQRADSFHPLAAVSLLDERLQAELAAPLEPSYPKTRYRVFEFLGTPLVGAFRGVSLELDWGCGSFSCELASGTVGWLSEDPLGPVDSPNLYGYVGLRPHEKTDPLGLQEKKRLSGHLYVPHGLVYTQHLTVQAEINDPTNPWLTRAGFVLFDTGVLPLAWAEEYGARGLLNIPHLVAQTTEYSSQRLVEGITEGDAAKVSEGIGGYLIAFSVAGSMFTGWSSEFRAARSAPREAPVETPAQVGVKELDVDLYGELNKRAPPHDGLQHDHSPSFASVKAAEEARLGRKLTTSEERALQKNSAAMVVRDAVHAQSRTFKGRNTLAQISQDAADLAAAARKDAAVNLQNLVREGADAAKVDEALMKLHELNRKLNRY